VEFGEALDFWRVIGVEEGKSLTLLAEMKLPGVATLNFDMKPRGEGAGGASVHPGTAGEGAGTELTMTARFRPKGVLGILYWYSVLPLHSIVFGGMLRGIKRAAEGARGAARPEIDP
jgi:hypothetical protein